MIVLQVEVADFAASQLEGNPPVAGDRNAPRSRTIAGELVNVPTRRSGKRGSVRRALQRGQYTTNPVHQVWPDLAVVIVLNEALQTPAAGAPDSHVFMYGVTVRAASSLERRR